CRGLSSTMASTPGADIVRCRIQPSRPSTAGIRRTAEANNEQPRRNSGIHPQKPAATGPCASRRSALRRQPAGTAACRIQSESAPHGRDLFRSAGLGDPLAPVRAKIADAKVVCSTVQEIGGNRDITGVSNPQDLADVDFAIVRASFGVAETGSIL